MKNALKFCTLLLCTLFFVVDLFALDTVVIVTPHQESIRREFGEKFAQWYQEKFGVPAKVDWRNVGGGNDVLRFIRSEFSTKPNGIGLDILFGCGIEPYFDLKQEGILAPCTLPKEVLDAIPQENRGTLIWDADRYWFGASLASFGILHNLRVVEYNHLPVARRWCDLTNPKLRNWLAISDPRNSSSMYSMMEAILQAYGWDRGWQILTGMAANTESIGRYAADPPRQTTYGNAATSICIDFYAMTQVNAMGRTNMLFVLPEDFSTLSPDGIALLKGGDNPIVAQRFIEFVLGEPGQKLWMFPMGTPEGPSTSPLLRMPVRKDLYERYPEYSPVEKSPFLNAEIETTGPTTLNNHFDNDVARKRQLIVCDLIGAQLVDTHSELTCAWDAAIAAGKAEEILADLAKPLITEADIDALLKNEYQDPIKRNRLKIRWQTEIQHRYRQILREMHQGG